MASSRLAGHGLRGEGNAHSMPGVEVTGRRSGPGLGLCECGTYSPRIKNRAQRKQWHKDHKDDIRAGGNGIVWRDHDLNEAVARREADQAAGCTCAMSESSMTSCPMHGYDAPEL